MGQKIDKTNRFKENFFWPSPKILDNFSSHIRNVSENQDLGKQHKIRGKIYFPILFSDGTPMSIILVITILTNYFSVTVTSLLLQKLEPVTILSLLKLPVTVTFKLKDVFDNTANHQFSKPYTSRNASLNGKTLKYFYVFICSNHESSN